MRSSLTVVFAATLVLSADPVMAGVIRGVLMTSTKSTNARAASDSAKTSKPTVQRGAGDAVVYLDKIPEKVEKKLTKPGLFRKARRPPRIVQRDLHFVPRVLATAVGGLVEFENLDRVYHNTFSVSAAKRFDLGKYAPGRLDTVVFDRVGVANLHCDIHPDESGFVVVVPNHAFTRPDSLGRFTLPKLPRGEYTVHVWHPRLGEFTRAVTMPKHGDLKLELKF
jgi:plastocyanin